MPTARAIVPHIHFYILSHALSLSLVRNCAEKVDEHENIVCNVASVRVNFIKENGRQLSTGLFFDSDRDGRSVKLSK